MEDNTPQSPKPTPGLKPRWLHEEQRNELGDPMDMMNVDLTRLYEVKGAVKRCIEADMQVPDAWLHELKDVIDHRLYSSMFLN